MKFNLILGIILLTSISSYNRDKAVEYAYKYYQKINHDCKKGRWSCSPYGYFGNNHCKYPKAGGDCANFVSQCLIEGGITFPKTCNVRKCNVILGAQSLGICLGNHLKWKRACGKRLPPPDWIEKGDVIVYHQGSCNSRVTHAMIVTVGGKHAKVSGHSPGVKDRDWTFGKTKDHYEWLHFEH